MPKPHVKRQRGSRSQSLGSSTDKVAHFAKGDPAATTGQGTPQECGQEIHPDITELRLDPSLESPQNGVPETLNAPESSAYVTEPPEPPEMTADRLISPIVSLLTSVDFLGDETYMLERPDGSQVHFNVTRARRFAEASGQEPQPFLPAAHGITLNDLRRTYLGLNEEYALLTLTDADLECPLLFGWYEDHTDLLDGWHRLFRAIATRHRRPFRCYILSQSDAEQFIFLRFPPGQGLRFTDHADRLVHVNRDGAVSEDTRSSGRGGDSDRNESERSLRQETPPAPL